MRKIWLIILFFICMFAFVYANGFTVTKSQACEWSDWLQGQWLKVIWNWAIPITRNYYKLDNKLFYPVETRHYDNTNEWLYLYEYDCVTQKSNQLKDSIYDWSYKKAYIWDIDTANYNYIVNVEFEQSKWWLSYIYNFDNKSWELVDFRLYENYFELPKYFVWEDFNCFELILNKDWTAFLSCDIDDLYFEVDLLNRIIKIDDFVIVDKFIDSFIQTLARNSKQEQINKITNLISKIEKLIQKISLTEDYKMVGILWYIKYRLYYKNIELDPSLKKVELESQENTGSADSGNLLLEKYFDSIISSKEVDQICTQRYEFVDEIAKQYDFPTWLIISFWKIEHGCYMDNPKNWYGMFQIMSRYYEPWEITEQEARDQIIDFIEFIRRKADYYMDRHWYEKSDIILNYSNYSDLAIQIYSLAYNWWSALPKDSNYANWNIDVSKKYKKDWTLTYFIKLLNRQKYNN